METDKKNASDPLEIDLARLHRTHAQGAVLRSGGSLLMLIFALGGYAAGHLKSGNIAGIGAATAYLLGMNPPVLWLIRRIRGRTAILLASNTVNLLEIVGYTAIIYFMGGLRALWLSPIYVVLIIYVGIWGPARQPFIVATFCGLCAGLMVWMEWVGVLPCQDPYPNFRLPGDAQAAMMVTAVSYLYVAAAVAAYMGSLIHRAKRKARQKHEDLEQERNKLEAARMELQNAHRFLEARVRERTEELSKVNERLAEEIAERNILLEKLHQSETLLKETQRMTRLGGWSYDVPSRELMWTEETYHIHELPPGNYADLIQRSLACYHEKDRPLLESAFRRAVETGEPYDLELRFTTAKGRPLWIRTLGKAQSEKGRVVRVSGNFMDITDQKIAAEKLKKSEDRYRFLAENMGDIVWTIDRNLRISYVSPSIEKILGFTPAEYEGRSLKEMITPDSYQRVMDQFQMVPQSGGDDTSGSERSVTVEMEHYHKAGHRVWLENSVKAMKGEEGELTGMYGVSRDIAERKQAEKERLSLERQLMQVQKSESLGRMAGAVAHHFNNQLFAVMGNIELALDDLAIGTVKRVHLDDALSCSERAAEISQLMLTYLGQSAGERKPVDLSDACRSGLKLLSATVPKKIRLVTRLPEIGPTVLADTVQIGQVITNLVANACEAIGGEAGEVVVALNLQPSAQIIHRTFQPADWRPTADTYASLSVSDNSRGMAPGVLDKIFDPFFSTKFTGRGLGLPVALGVAKAHDGALAVASRPDQGTTVELFLPILPPVEETAGSGIGAVRRGATRRRILLVEDEVQVRRTAAAFLMNMGCDVVMAQNGAEAIEVCDAEADTIHCVLLDLNMPVMNGWETLTELRKRHPDLPVVMTSGYEEAHVMSGHEKQRPQAFLHKPYHRRDLERAIAGVLGRRRPD